MMPLHILFAFVSYWINSTVLFAVVWE